MSKYDLAVVGAGLGGLAAATLASRFNKRTVVLEPSASAGGAVDVFRKNGFNFHPGPDLVFGFERGGALQRLNETLGMGLNETLRSPGYQVALPDRRITVFAEQSETLDELRREFPNEIDKILRFYGDLGKQAVRNSKSGLFNFISRFRSAAGSISRYRFSREFLAFLDVQSYYFFNRPVSALPHNSLVTLCDSTPQTVQGGFKKVAEQIVDLLLKNGGEIRYHVPLAEIAQTERAISISGEEIESNAVLLNTQRYQRGPILCFGIRDDVVPVGILPVVLCISDYAHPERFFTLCMSNKDDETAAPRQMRSLLVEFNAGEQQQSLEDRMQRIRTLVPFLDEFLLFTQEYRQPSRIYQMPGNASWKPIGSQQNRQLLNRSSQRGLYLLYDGMGTPAETVAAAQRFVERVMQ